MTPDPLGYGAGSPNLYTAMNGDPVNHRDPTGLSSQEAAAYVVGLMNKGYSRDYALEALRHTSIEYDERELTLMLVGAATGPVATRLTGGFQAMGGCTQVALGTAALATPEPTMATKVAGGALIARGIDNCQAGVRQVISGKPTNTVVGSIVQNNLQKVMKPESAAELDMWLELMVDTGLTAKGSVGQSRTNSSIGKAFHVRPTGDIDPAAHALATEINGVPSATIDNVVNREFDAISDEYVGQTTDSASARNNPKNYLKASKKAQIRDTLYAARKTGRTALFEFRGGAPSPEVLDFINRAAAREGVAVEIRTK